MHFIRILITHLVNYDRWFYPGIISLKTRYSRTALGPFWETITISIFIGFAGFLWSKIFRIDIQNFIPHLFCGMVIWKFYATVIGSSALTYIENGALIKSIKHEYITHNLKCVFRDFLIFLHNLPICLLVVFYFNGFNLNILYLFFVFPIVIISAFFISYILSLVCLRYRDLHYLIQSLMQLIFFFTPIMWKPDQIESKVTLFVVKPNIIYHYVEIIRSPILGSPPPLLSLGITILFMFFLLFVVNFLYQKYNNRIPYWL
jgi:lipopolysaccharide transport system permease protein